MNVRHVIVALSALASSLVFWLRLNLNIAIVAMVKNTNVGVNSSLHHANEACPVLHNYTRIRVQKGGEFDWSPSLQGIVLSSYFYGYISTQIVGGRWAEKWGAKWVCGIGVLGSSVFSLLAPISAKFVLLFCAVRAVVGVFHGLVFSSLFRLLSLWLPANERGSVVAFVFAAGQFAGVYTLPLVSFLCESNFLGGWPSAFYIFGLSGCLLSLIWFLYITDKPDDHPQISEAELQFIQKGVEKSDKSKKELNWCHVLCSTAVWAAVIGKMTTSFGYYLISNELPIYLQNIINVPIRENGFLNSYIYLVVAFGMFFSGKLSNYIRSKNIVSLTIIRKIFQAIASFGPCICLMIVPFVGCNKNYVITLLVISMFLYGFCGGGELLIVADFAPNFSGTIFGIANLFTILSAILGPSIVGWLLNENVHDKHQWDFIFYICASIFAFGGIFFSIFATAKPAVWG